MSRATWKRTPPLKIQWFSSIFLENIFEKWELCKTIFKKNKLAAIWCQKQPRIQIFDTRVAKVLRPYFGKCGAFIYGPVHMNRTIYKWSRFRKYERETNCNPSVKSGSETVFGPHALHIFLKSIAQKYFSQKICLRMMDFRSGNPTFWGKIFKLCTKLCHNKT